MEQNKQSKASTIAKIGILSAVGTILYLFVKFPLPFFPSFLDIQFSELAGLLAGFMMGPVAGIAVIVLKGLIKMPFSSTACVGELADILIGIAFILPAAWIYRKKKCVKSAILGLAAGLVCATAVAIVANRFLLIPFYLEFFFHGSWDPLLGMCSMLNPNLTPENFYEVYLWAGVLPFNLLRGTISCLITYFVYKPLHRLFNRF